MEARNKSGRNRRGTGRRQAETARSIEPLEPRRLLSGFSTIQLTALPTAAGDVGPSHLTASGADLFFEATGATTNQLAVYVSDGTAAGTTELALPAGASGAASDLLAATGPTTTAAPLVYFTVGSAVYRSDGTAAGTTAIALPASADATAAGTTVAAVGTLGNDVIVDVDNGTTATLWSSDGTAAGSTDLGPAPSGLAPGGQSLTVGGFAYFSLGGDLYATNGTAAQTAAQADTGAAQLYDFSTVNNEFFFAAAGGSLGTTQVLDVISGFGAGPVTLATGTTVANLTPLATSLLFSTTNSSGNTALMATTGTPASTTTLVGAGAIGDIEDISDVAGKVFFVGVQSGAVNLYTTDGTSGGLTSVKALGSPSSFTYASGTVDLASQATFLAPTSNSSAALWTSFGITATTNPQLTNVPAGRLALAGNNLLFDAVPAPATAAADIAAGGAASGPGQLYVLNGTGAGVSGGGGTTTGGGGSTGGGTGTGGGGTTTTTTPTLSVAVASATLPSVFVPGDTGIVRLTLTNSGAAAATGIASVQLYLSPDGAVASGIALLAPAVERVAVKLAPGRSVSLAAKFTVPPDVTAGSEQVLAVLSSLGGFATGSVSSTPAVSSATDTAALSFGAVGSRKRVRLISAIGGAPIVYQLLGPGTATLTPQADGNDAMSVTGTTAASSIVVTVAGRGITDTLDAISVQGPLLQLLGPEVNLNGDLAIAGSVRRVVLASVAGAHISFGGTLPAAVSLGVVAGSSLVSSDPLSALVVSAWDADAGGAPGTISVASIGTLSDAGNFSADLAAASINVLLVRGSVSDSDILAGANFGANGILGGGDDTFAAGTIRIVEILGSVTGDSTIAAGLDVTDDLFPPDATDTLLTGGRIDGVVIRGELAAGSLVLAASLPGHASVGGHAVATAQAAGFALP